MVSIIIPVYNGEKYIRECIESIQNQTYSDLEICIVDDGSEDKTVDKIRECLKGDNRIRLYQQNNQGVSCARNAGLKHITGIYTYFCDGDDYLSPDALEKMVQAMEEESKVDLVLCGYYINDKPAKIVPQKRKKLLDQNETAYEVASLHGFGGYLWNKLFRTEIIKANSLLFDETVHFREDALFCFQYISSINTSTYLNESLYYYRQYDTSTVGQRNVEKTKTALKIETEMMRIATEMGNTNLVDLCRINHLTNCIQLIKQSAGRFEFKQETGNWKKEIRRNLFMYLSSKEAPFRCKIRAVIYALK